MILGVIGGSGLYDMSGISDVKRVVVETPWGLPSDEIVTGVLEGTSVAFLPRHGRGHRFSPTEVPYLANVAALKKLGCEFVVSVSAVGSLKEEIVPGHLVVVDQFIDRTTHRERTFFGNGIVGHVPFADPVCPTLRPILLAAARATKAPVTDGGTYVCIEGPTFSTRAESHLFRSWGASVVGMTNLPEARLAREAGLSYATLALATDYDCWRESDEGVSVEAVIAVLQKNVAAAQEAVRGVAKALAQPGAPKTSPFQHVAKDAIMTAREAAPIEAKRKLAAIIGNVLG
ncbi:MAG TPA: S-methyl-5'-thioadenosine phosphorylase [Myxococcota bacterium]|jgi:5'-methylthioadenosine phosphorylase